PSALPIWHTHSCAGIIQPIQVILHPKDSNASILSLESFHALEYGLPVVKGGIRGGNGELPEWNDFRCLPLSVLILNAEHVIRKDIAKSGIIQIYFIDSALAAFPDVKWSG